MVTDQDIVFSGMRFMLNDCRKR